MIKTPIRRGQLWEDNRTGRQGQIMSYSGRSGWTIVWIGRTGVGASRHLDEFTLRKYHHLVIVDEKKKRREN